MYTLRDVVFIIPIGIHYTLHYIRNTRYIHNCVCVCVLFSSEVVFHLYIPLDICCVIPVTSGVI